MKQIILIMAVIFISLPGFSQKRGKRVKLELTGRNYYIRCVANQKYLDIPGYSGNAQKDNGADVQLWDLDDGLDRRVKFIPAGNGYYHIRFQHAKMNMDVHGCYSGKWFCGTYKDEKGANVQIWSAGSSKPQEWKLKQINPGQFQIKNRYSGKVLDASGGGRDKNGETVHQWDWHGGDNQLWELVDVKTGHRYQL
jgi:hypothetical protein